MAKSKIKAVISRNSRGDIFAVEIRDHGKDIVCAAVSALAINAANSIEAFTALDFTCDIEESGGYLRLEIPSIKAGGSSSEAKLLLDSLVLGLNGIHESYGDCIKIIDKEVH